MARRLFSNDTPSVTFTKDFRQLLHGDLEPGKPVAIIYDAERLPKERSLDQGKKAWTIQACYKFFEQGEVRTIDLWTETGTILTKIGDEPGEGTMMVCRINLPPDADHLTMWFLNAGKSGARFWDSNFGANYTFRFVAHDFHITSVGVLHDAAGPTSWFEIEILALPEIYDLAVAYRITNDPQRARTDQHLPLIPATSLEPQGLRKWTGRAPIPETAVVKFTVAYYAYGNPHADTNSGKGYVTWPGAVRNVEAGVL